MSTLTPSQIAQLALTITGQLTLPPDTEHPLGRIIIIQGATEENYNARTPGGHPIIIYDKPLQTYSRTPAQDLRREMLTEANEYYRNMTEPQKEALRPLAEARHITRYNLAVSLWMNGHNERTRAHWDNDHTYFDEPKSIWRTTWDNQTAVWDYGFSLWLN